MATGGKQRGTREERERARVYQARQEFHDGRSRRRTRDNLIAGIGGGVLIVAVTLGQAAYFMTGPGAPALSPSPTSTSTPSPAPSATPSGEPTVTPEPTPTPTS